jgi:hypothetical protein
LKLCTWLVTAGAASAEIASHVAIVDVTGLRPLQPRLLVGGRGAEVVGGDTGGRSIETGIRTLSEVLLPPPISTAILDKRLDTLIVVPVTITIPAEGDRGRATEMLGAFGTMSFSLLRLGPARDTSVVDVASVTMAPGFAAMDEVAAVGVRSSPTGADQVVVVGDPANPAYAPLPGARAEAIEVAARLGTRALVGSEATRSAVWAALRARAARLRLVLVATHGVADSANPLDGSFLVMHDALLTAREISTLRLARKPVVILSACETGAGRDFEVGTIGLARAWQRAGASAVVMSLWRIDDTATRELMVDLVQRLATAPPDRALQHAMRGARDRRPDPALWAGFSVFGLP